CVKDYSPHYYSGSVTGFDAFDFW
nr:immunoglobulin heavy chain junction region [Macaca mulatta]